MKHLRSFSGFYPDIEQIGLEFFVFAIGGCEKFSEFGGFERDGEIDGGGNGLVNERI